MKPVIMMFAGLALSACASAPRLPPADDLFDDARFAVPAQPVDDPLALSPAMRAYLDGDLAARVRRVGAARGLAEALQAELSLEYDAAQTRTAAQAFAGRTGNCLSLVLLSAALARELEVPIRFRSIRGYDTVSRSDEWVFVSGHVNVLLGTPANSPVSVSTQPAEPALVVDFMPPRAAQRLFSVEIPERTVLAMFHNNRAAEALVAGDLDAAYAAAQRAIRLDPGYAAAYNSLGLVYRRHGDAPLAERVLRRGLQLEPENPRLLGALAGALDQQQRPAEAAQVRQRLAEVLPYPPFWFLDQGLQRLAAGDMPEALRLLRREQARMPHDHEVNFALAVASYLAGQPRLAERYLRLARDYSPTAERRALYAAKLDRLRAQSRDLQRPGHPNG